MSHVEINSATKQEISELLSNTLTLDEEEAVQTELLELQAQHVSSRCSCPHSCKFILDFSLTIRMVLTARKSLHLNCLQCQQQDRSARLNTCSPNIKPQESRYLWRHETVIHMYRVKGFFHSNNDLLPPRKVPKTCFAFLS